MLKIEMGIGWKPDPEKPGGLVSATIRDYVTEIERLRSIVRVNGLRWGHTHAEIDAILNEQIRTEEER
jgi:hypothetical protein